RCRAAIAVSSDIVSLLIRSIATSEGATPAPALPLRRGGNPSLSEPIANDDKPPRGGIDSYRAVRRAPVPATRTQVSVSEMSKSVLKVWSGGGVVGIRRVLAFAA